MRTVLRVELLVDLLYSVGGKGEMPTCTTAVLTFQHETPFHLTKTVFYMHKVSEQEKGRVCNGQPFL